MPNRLLWPNLSHLSRRLADVDDIGVLTDADGTLSEISAHPELARVSVDITRALAQLNGIYPLVAIVSGRRAQDVRVLVGRDDLIYLGNHGLERWENHRLKRRPEFSAAALTIRRAKADLVRDLPEAEGLYLEDKELVLALHYRQCRVASAVEVARREVRRAADRYQLKMQDGRQVVEIGPAIADKGRAILELAEEYRLKQVIYLGDDYTDIDAFQALAGAENTSRLSSIRIAVVGSESPPALKDHADYWVASVGEVRRFLEWLVEWGRCSGAAQRTESRKRKAD